VFGGAGDADPRRGRDLRLARTREQDEWRAIERAAVVLAGDAERLAEASGAGGEEAGLVEAPALAHPLDAVGRFEGS
jgi:hypothetical protein